jgi:hypothetical protein
LKYIFTEVGHAAQTVGLQTVSLELGIEVLGAFRSLEVIYLLSMQKN